MHSPFKHYLEQIHCFDGPGSVFGHEMLNVKHGFGRVLQLRVVALCFFLEEEDQSGIVADETVLPGALWA